MTYVELHARSAFSFLRGAAAPEDYAATAARLELPAMALADCDGVYGSARFYLAMKKAGLRGHTGAEVLCTDGARYPLLVKNRIGYNNLCRLITRTKLRTSKHPKPGMEAAATPEELEEFAPGLLCLTGDAQGPLAAALRQRQARKCLDRLAGIFGQGGVYVELQRHYDRDEEARNDEAVALAGGLKLPLIASNGVCHVHPAEREILDVFTCLHHKTTLAKAGRLLSSNAERHLKSGPQMSKLFDDYPEAIANTLEASSQLGFELTDLGYEFPRYPVPSGQSEMQFLRERTLEAGRLRYQSGYKRAKPQLEHELRVIEKLNLAGYFLVVWDLINFCREEGILAQGRGSAANSAVCYSLGITAVDPVGMGLLFERFLSEERGGEWPDIDIDLPSGDKRESVIQHVYKRYGERGAAMTANVITYRQKSAAREVGKVLEFDEATLDRLSSLVPVWGWKDPENSSEKQFRDAGLDLSDFRIAKFYELVTGILDLPRHLGQHSGGMVICQGQLDSIVPLEPSSMPNRVVVQWDKEDCADLGLIKVDLLGLGMMAVLEESLVLIREHEHKEIDLGRLPQDPDVYEMLQRADSIGLFQVESRAQMATLPRLKPKEFYDLVVQVAIIRPGPIVGKMVHPYLARRQGREPIEPLHPLLEPVLARTLGVPLFQEQLLRMAMTVADFTGGEAEELRRAMGFKRSQDRMKDIERRLRVGMTSKGITGSVQDTIVQSITSFALYGFPESHAASFALLAYASAWLKFHHLAAFTCAMLNNQPMGFYHPAVLVKDAQRHGLKVLPVDITSSLYECSLEAMQLRLGFNYVRGLRAENAHHIVEERNRESFLDIDDLARRAPGLRKDELAILAEIGALNPLGTGHRRNALWQATRVGLPAGPLLEQVPETDPESPLTPMTLEERVQADYRGTSLTVGRHPIAHHRGQLNALGVTAAINLKEHSSGRWTKVAGSVIVRQRPGTAKGILFISLEDETGIANVVVMPDIFAENRLTVLNSGWLFVEGPLQNVDSVIHVNARKIGPLSFNPIAKVSHNFH